MIALQPTSPEAPPRPQERLIFLLMSLVSHPLVRSTLSSGERVRRPEVAEPTDAAADCRNDELSATEGTSDNHYIPSVATQSLHCRRARRISIVIAGVVADPDDNLTDLISTALVFRIRHRRAATGIRNFLLAMLGATHGILRAHALTSITDATIATAATAWVNNPSAATGTYGAIGDWDTSAVTTMSGVFKDKSTFNDDISKWNTASVTDMSEVFSYGPSANFMNFNQNIGSWNVASVSTMYRMFYLGAFGRNIGGWNTARVANFREALYKANFFNQDIGSWNVASATDIAGMLWMASSTFNHDISSWNVARATTIENLLFDTPAFNQNIGKWNVASVTKMDWAFSNCVFNQNIGSWNTARVITMLGTFQAAKFNANIAKWNTASVTSMANMFRNTPAFDQDVSRWSVARSMWSFFQTFDGASALSTGNKACIYSKWGGTLQAAYPSWSGTCTSSTTAITNTNFATAVAAWITNPVTATTTYGPIGEWDTSAVTSMASTFSSQPTFNDNIGSWNVASVSNMYGLFHTASVFNQNIAEWNMASVTDLSYMLKSAAVFNQNIGGWNVARASTMSSAFASASAFDQNLANWNVVRATTLTSMFDSTGMSTATKASIYSNWGATLQAVYPTFGPSTPSPTSTPTTSSPTTLSPTSTPTTASPTAAPTTATPSWSPTTLAPTTLSPTMLMVTADCRLPTSLGAAIVAAQSNACVAGGVLARGARCDVVCEANFIPSLGATTQYECSMATGVLVVPSLTCTSFTQLQCNLPSELDGYTSAEVNGCTRGGSLLSSQDPSATDLNTWCAVQCMQGYVGDTGSRKYSCRGPMFSEVPSLRCTLAAESKCALPKSFGAGVQGGTCEAGRELASRTQCTVVCSTDYVAVNGLTSDDFVFSCVAGRLNVPAASCRPESTGFEPKVVGHAFSMSLAGLLANFGTEERRTLALYIARKLGLNADRDLELTFSSGSVIIGGLVLGSPNPHTIVDMAFALAARIDDTWPLDAFPVVAARYDGPVLQAKPNYCRAFPGRSQLALVVGACILASRHPARWQQCIGNGLLMLIFGLNRARWLFPTLRSCTSKVHPVVISAQAARCRLLHHVQCSARVDMSRTVGTRTLVASRHCPTQH